MNPWDLSASDLLIWGIVLHLIADWPLQNDWMANNKAKRALRPGVPDTYPWWNRHPAAYVHAGIHMVLLTFVFGYAATPLALAHLVIDTRAPVAWWSKVMRQTQPAAPVWISPGPPVMDVGMEVRFWTDQTAHIMCIAIAALVV